MEDALVLLVGAVPLGLDAICLNPCFNGRCTRTRCKTLGVFQDISLNPCFNGRCTRT